MKKTFLTTTLLYTFLAVSNNITHEAEKVFTHYYETSYWDPEVPSGGGSKIIATGILRKELQNLLRTYNIKSINDAPCGDFNWMKLVNLANYEYRGFDIVKSLVERNNKQFSRPNLNFYHANLIEDILPQSDIIFCRDTLAHLPLKECIKVIQNFKKSKSKYILVTTYTRTTYVNQDIALGGSRPINLFLPPFSFCQPLELIKEGCPELEATQYSDKCMGLWLLDDIVI